MSWVRCGCGRVLRAPGFAELLDLADEHVHTFHPDLIGTLSPLELARPPRRLRTPRSAAEKRVRPEV